MAGLGKAISDVLKGDFLIRENAEKSWRVIFMILGASIVMITCSHKTDEKVMRIGALKKEIRALKAEYIDSATRLTRMKMESSVKEKVKKDGLVPSKTPPVKIIVESDNNFLGW